MDYADLTRRLRRHTEPNPAAVARVRSRLDRALLPATPELSRLPPVSSAAVARVKARLAEPRRRPVPAWLLGGGLAFAAVGVLAGGWWGLAGEEVPTTLALSGGGVERLGGFEVDHDGDGQAVSVGRALRVDWEYGRLALAVPPNGSVAVVTPEGAVDAGPNVGLVVVRGPMGTRIEITGEASVRCGSDPAEIRAGAVDCDPLTATGWLTRARAEQGDGGVDRVLADVDRGLALAPETGAVPSELVRVRVDALLGAGRNAEALDAAESALAVTDDPARLEDLHRTAAHLALMAQDCDRAGPHLAALTAPTADERSFQERCSAR